MLEEIVLQRLCRFVVAVFVLVVAEQIFDCFVESMMTAGDFIVNLLTTHEHRLTRWFAILDPIVNHRILFGEGGVVHFLWERE